MVTCAKEVTITEIADFMQEKKQANERLSVVLGSRAGGLFGNENLYSTLSGYSLVAFNELSQIERFQECYKILSDTTTLNETGIKEPRFSEREIDKTFKTALRSMIGYRKDDEFLVDLALEGFFHFIVTTNIDALLEGVFLFQTLKQPDDYRVIVAGRDDSVGIFPNKPKYVSLLKIFGDFESRRYKTVGNLFDLESDPLLKGSLGRILMDDVLVLGYDPMWDHPLEQAFPKTGKSIWYINEEPPEENTYLAEVLKSRQGKYLAGWHGSYGGFIRSIYGHVSSGKSSVKNTKPLPAIAEPTVAEGQGVRKKVFISYSHEDVQHLERLKTHLKYYLHIEKDSDLLNIWDDTQIPHGADWDKEIKKALATTRVAVALVSADFLASDFILNHELPCILAAVEAGEVEVLSVVLSPCAFQHSPLHHYQAVNDVSQPLISADHYHQELIWHKLTESIYKLLKKPQ